MGQLRYGVAVTEPERVLRELAVEEAEAVQKLADVRQRIKLVRKMLETQQAWVDQFGADPRPDNDPPPEPQSRAQGGSRRGGDALFPDDAADTSVGSVIDIDSSQPRRVQVVNLLAQDPTRWWKTREVGEALGIANYKSLRILLTQLASKEELIKSSDASYRYNDGNEIPEPMPHAAHKGAAM